MAHSALGSWNLEVIVALEMAAEAVDGLPCLTDPESNSVDPFKGPPKESSAALIDGGSSAGNGRSSEGKTEGKVREGERRRRLGDASHDLGFGSRM